MAVPDFTEDAFFRTVTFSWPRDRPGLVLPVANQGTTDSCVAHVIRDTVYPQLVPIYEDLYRRKRNDTSLTIRQMCELGPQEMLCLVPYYTPSTDFDINKPLPKEGVPVSYQQSFEYMKNLGVYLEIQCPFQGEWQGEVVKPTLYPDTKIFIEDYKEISPKNLVRIVQQLQKQPLATSILYVESFALWKADQGVYRGATQKELNDIENKKRESCGGWSELWHALTIEGYGVEADVAYYLCRNSYGPKWGHHGYIKISRDVVGCVYYPISPALKKASALKKRTT